MSHGMKTSTWLGFARVNGAVSPPAARANASQRQTACQACHSNGQGAGRSTRTLTCIVISTLQQGVHSADQQLSKRSFLASSAATLASAAAVPPAQAAGLDPFAKKDMRPPKQRGKVDESEYKDGPQGLKYYDVKQGEGPKADEGDRVAVHYECKWKGVTFQTSRIGPGVTGGEPYGFDVGATGNTKALRGMDIGVRGMQKGGVRKLIVPPELGYGNVQVMEIPPNATLEVNVELLSVKNTPLGYKARPKFEAADSSKPAKKTMFDDA